MSLPGNLNYVSLLCKHIGWYMYVSCSVMFWHDWATLASVQRCQSPSMLCYLLGLTKIMPLSSCAVHIFGCLAWFLHLNVIWSRTRRFCLGLWLLQYLSVNNLQPIYSSVLLGCWYSSIVIWHCTNRGERGAARHSGKHCTPCPGWSWCTYCSFAASLTLKDQWLIMSWQVHSFTLAVERERHWVTESARRREICPDPRIELDFQSYTHI